MFARLSKAVVLGLALGAGASALTLGVMAITRHVDCSGLQAEECTFERESSNHLAQQQALAALGLALVGGGLGLSLSRARAKEKK